MYPVCISRAGLHGRLAQHLLTIEFPPSLPPSLPPYLSLLLPPSLPPSLPSSLPPFLLPSPSPPSPDLYLHSDFTAGKNQAIQEEEAVRVKGIFIFPVKSCGAFQVHISMFTFSGVFELILSPPPLPHSLPPSLPPLPLPR